MLLKHILSPDKVTYMIKPYHSSTKLLIPLTSICLINNNFNDNNSLQKSYFSKFLYTTNIINIGFHSYISCSSIISDYIKPKKIMFYTRVFNLKLHIVSYIGLTCLVNL